MSKYIAWLGEIFLLFIICFVADFSVEPAAAELGVTKAHMLLMFLVAGACMFAEEITDFIKRSIK